MNLLMLDIDGVLNSVRYWYDSGRHLPLKQPRAIDPEAISRLNRIIAATDAKVVISSSWRARHDGSDLQEILDGRGFSGEIIGRTPFFLGSQRCAEIADYLVRFPFAIDRCVILDDDSDAWDTGYDLFPQVHFVQTDFNIGLTDEHVPLVIAYLNGDPP